MLLCGDNKCINNATKHRSNLKNELDKKYNIDTNMNQISAKALIFHFSQFRKKIAKFSMSDNMNITRFVKCSEIENFCNFSEILTN